MTGSATVCCMDCINCTALDGWKKCTEVMAVATELYRNCATVALSAVQYRDSCCSTGAKVALSAVQYSDRLLFYRCYSGTVCCAVQRYIAVLPVLQWHCLLCSTAIYCCSTGATVALSAVQYSDRLLFYRCYSGTVCCAVQR